MLDDADYLTGWLLCTYCFTRWNVLLPNRAIHWKCRNIYDKSFWVFLGFFFCWMIQVRKLHLCSFWRHDCCSWSLMCSILMSMAIQQVIPASSGIWIYIEKISSEWWGPADIRVHLQTTPPTLLQAVYLKLLYEHSSVHANAEYYPELFTGHRSARESLPDSVIFRADMWTRLNHVTVL